MSGLRLVTAVTALNPVLGDLELDEHGQLVWCGLTSDVSDQQDEIAQRIRTRLLMIRGEWYQDQREGTPWRELSAKGVSDLRIASVLRRVVAGTPGVGSVSEVSVVRDRATRTAAVIIRAIADTGEAIGPLRLDLPFIVTEAP